MQKIYIFIFRTNFAPIETHEKLYCRLSAQDDISLTYFGFFATEIFPMPHLYSLGTHVK